MQFSSFFPSFPLYQEANVVCSQQELAAQTGDAKVPKPAKQVPENAAAMHPVMVLHQMRPGVQYNISQLNKEGKIFFAVSSDIDGQTFIGEGESPGFATFMQ